MDILQLSRKRIIRVVIFVVIIYNVIPEIRQIYKALDPQAIDNNNEDIFTKRLERLKSLCSSLTSDGGPLISNTKLISSNLYWLPKSKIVYCPVFKSASSTWLENLIHLSGATPERLKEAKQRHRGSLVDQIKHVGAIKPSEKVWIDFVNQNQTQDLTSFMVGALRLSTSTETNEESGSS